MATDRPDGAFATLVRTLADADWRADVAVDPADIAAALPRLRAQGLLPGIARRLEATPAGPALDPSTRRTLQDAARAASARELASARPLADALAALADARIPVLVVKGEALASQAYPLPGLRERGDVDAWVPDGEFARAEQALASLGFLRRPAASGEWLQPEATWIRADAGALLALDLHRRLFAQHALAAVLPFAEVLAASAPFASGARIPAPMHALLIAALHRIAHHADDDRLVWTWDVHQLCTRFPGAADAAARTARERGVAAILGDALARSAQVFGTQFEDGFVAALLARAHHERSARLLQPMAAPARWWFDLRSLPDMRARRRWVAETLFPSPAYMRARFGAGPLAWLYAKRAVGGAWAALFRR